MNGRKSYVRRLTPRSSRTRGAAPLMVVLIPLVMFGMSGCSEGDGGNGGTGGASDEVSVATATSTLISSVPSADPTTTVESGVIISEKDLLLSTADAASAKLNSGSKKISVEILNSFSDASLSMATDKGSWLVTAVCFVLGKPDSVELISRSPSELTAQISEEVRSGRSPDEFPIGECDTDKKQISIG